MLYSCRVLRVLCCVSVSAVVCQCMGVGAGEEWRIFGSAKRSSGFDMS